MPITHGDLKEGKTYRYNFRNGEVSLLRYTGECHWYAGIKNEHFFSYMFEDVFDEIKENNKAEFVPFDIHTERKTISKLPTYLCFFEINCHPDVLKEDKGLNA
jgi:hypothetical protein